MILTTEYQVVTGKSGLKDFEITVSELVKKGWLPTGGIAFNLGYPYQAMIKETTKLKERDTNAPLEQNPA